MATLSDIAKKAKVSQAAVSRVLNQDPTFVVSKEVRLAIRKAAAELGYRTPRQKKDKIKIIKVGVADWHSVPVSRRWIVSYENLVPLSQLDAEYSFTRLEKGKTQAVDAIIAVGIFSDEEVNELILSSQNIIFLNNNHEVSMFDKLFIDYDTAVRKSFKWLKAQGKERIAFINVINEEDGITIGKRRTESVRAIMEEEGIYDPELFLVDNLTDKSGSVLMTKAMERNADAVVMGTQLIEKGVMEVYDSLSQKPTLVLRRDIDLDYKRCKFPVVRMCSEQLWDITNLLIYSRLKRPSLPLTVGIQATFEVEGVPLSDF